MLRSLQDPWKLVPLGQPIIFLLVFSSVSYPYPFISFVLRYPSCDVTLEMSIQKIFDHMKDECVNNGKKLCVITLDYKMKLDPLYFREKTVDHYGKRGMSWHGSMVQYYTMENFEETSAPFLNKLYLDHIVDNKNKQDKLAVISILESVILAIRKHLPNIDQIILQSDNVGCYQNTMLMLLIPYLSYAHVTHYPYGNAGREIGSRRTFRSFYATYNIIV